MEFTIEEFLAKLPLPSNVRRRGELITDDEAHPFQTGYAYFVLPMTGRHGSYSFS